MMIQVSFPENMNQLSPVPSTLQEFRSFVGLAPRLGFVDG